MPTGFSLGTFPGQVCGNAFFRGIVTSSTPRLFECFKNDGIGVEEELKLQDSWGWRGWSSSGQMSHIKMWHKMEFHGAHPRKENSDLFSLGKKQDQTPVRAPVMGPAAPGVSLCPQQHPWCPQSSPWDGGAGIPLPWEQQEDAQSSWLGYHKWALQGAGDQSSPDRSQIHQQQHQPPKHTHTPLMGL